MKRTAIRSLLAAGGWLVLAFVPASPRAISSVPAAAPTACAWTRRRRTSNKMMVSQHNDAFDVCVDLGEGSGVAQIQLQPYFTESDLVTIRLPLPIELEAEPIQGVYKVVKPGYGLLIGDVLRAFSTMAIRYDSQLKEVRCGPGVPGQLPAGSEHQECAVRQDINPIAILTSTARRGLEKLLGPSIDELGAFAETKPAKCLFIADGQPHCAVEDALVANVQGKTREIVMIFERPFEPRVVDARATRRTQRQ
jgi:hypothetical protein